MWVKRLSFLILSTGMWIACTKSGDPAPVVDPPAASFGFESLKVNGNFSGFAYKDVTGRPTLKFAFSVPIDSTTIRSAVSFNSASGQRVPFSYTTENGDSSFVIRPVNNLPTLSRFTLVLNKSLRSKAKGALLNDVSVSLTTAIDSADKFPAISDDALLTLVQKQTFRYFWEFAHPVSGLARERNTSGDVVTSGGSGFGIMAIPVAIERRFITRAQGLERMQKVVGFLKNNVQKYHGAFPHWLNGVTGETVPFSTKDNGADLVETSLLMQGLLTVRQYFNSADAAETALRADINALWQSVEWDWFRRNNQNVLYWHWSPTNDWDMNLPIRGWNECLITYVLAASSTSHAIPKVVYDEGWAGSSSFKNGNTYYGVKLPLGVPNGGPMFFSHYSFLGINPKGLSDPNANYAEQTKNHALINYNYCKANPLGYAGYSDQCWGLTACDIPNGYNANAPGNDQTVIAPTAALASMPYTPEESMKALRFFYYKLGDKLWGDYGFYDAFSIEQQWFASSNLAIDQGPIILMIENYRTGLPWKLFMSCPEVQTGMKKLGFSGPSL